MATLLIDRSDLELRLDADAIALYESGARRGATPIRLLDRVILQGNLRLETSVIGKLAEAGVPILILSKRHARRSAIILGPAHNDAGIRLAQSRRTLDPAWRLAWARRLILGKTRGQIRLLREGLGARPDQRKPLHDAIESLIQAHAALKEITPGAQEEDNASLIARVRGLEGAAARAYFQGYAALLPPALEFHGRNRRPPRDPVNACLSLGYTLLHFEAVRASQMAGLDPLLGFYHRPSFGRESLASDLIEPLRPHLDRQVWRLFRERDLRPDHFSRDGAACLLGKTGRATFYQDHEAQAAPGRRLLQRQCRILARHLRNQGEPLLAEADQEEEFA